MNKERVKKQMDKMNINYSLVRGGFGNFDVEVMLYSGVDYDLAELLVLKQMVKAEDMKMEMVYDYDSSYMSLKFAF